MTHCFSKEKPDVEFLFPISCIICILAQPSPSPPQPYPHGTRTLGDVRSLRFSVILDIYLSIYTITGYRQQPFAVELPIKHILSTATSATSNKQPISLAVSGAGVPGISPPLVCCCCCCAAQLVLTQKADPRSNEGSGSVLQRCSAAVLDLTLQHPGHHALHPTCRGEDTNFTIDIHSI